jgi:hypothetical protein
MIVRGSLLYMAACFAGSPVQAQYESLGAQKCQ